MQIQGSFLDIASRFRAVFFDAYGVLKNSAGLLPGALDAVATLKARGVECFVITNDASRSPALLAQAYIHPGLGALFPEERIISSGLLAREYLALKVRQGTVAYLGKEASAFYVESAGLKPVALADLKEQTHVDAVAFLDDEGFDWFAALNRTLNLIRHRTMPVVVANADQSYPARNSDIAIAVGGLAQLVESISGRTFVRFGKPDTQIFSYAFARAREVMPALTKREALMVGDTLATDILGGNKFGFATLLTLSGNTEAEAVQRLIASSGVIPDFICPSIGA